MKREIIEGTTLNKGISIFLMGGLAGMGFTILIINILGEVGSDAVSSGGSLYMQYMHQYELVAVIVGGTNSLAFARQFGSISGLIFSIGYGLAMPAVVMSIRPEENTQITWAANFISVFLFYVLAEIVIKWLEANLGFEEN